MPRIVVAIGIPVDSARASSSSWRPKRWISTSARIIGRLRRREHRRRLVERLAERVGVARRQARPAAGAGSTCRASHLVAGDLEVDRPLVPHGRLEHPVDLAEGGQRVVEHGRGDRDLLEDLELRLEPLDLVVQSGFRARSESPGEPLSTITGDFSA